jgi:CRP-like cAMP-binding protein
VDPKIQALEQAPLFAGLSRKEIEELARAGEELDVAAGKALTSEGQLGHEFFVLLEGEAEVRAGGERIATLGPGDFFGEIALLEEIPRTATVTATTPLRFFVLTRHGFRTVVKRYAGVEAKVRDAVARRPH